MSIRRQTATIRALGQLILAMRMEDNASFFNFVRMEPLRVGLRIQQEMLQTRDECPKRIGLA